MRAGKTFHRFTRKGQVESQQRMGGRGHREREIEIERETEIERKK